MHHLIETMSFLGCSLEWWAFETLVLLSGLLPNPQLETSVLSIWYSPTSRFRKDIHFDLANRVFNYSAALTLVFFSS